MFWIFLILFTIQICFDYLYRYRFPSIKDSNKNLPNVSVLICGKNEAENFKQNLPFFLKQNYPFANWEIVIVNDGSKDNTDTVLQEFTNLYLNLKIVKLPIDFTKIMPGKKQALFEGLKQCKYDLVLLSDADCKPNSENWITKMASAYNHLKTKNPNASIFVLGYGAYQKNKGLLNRYIRWETRHTFMQYASWAQMGSPYMAVGRNLMYEKKSVLNLLENDESFLKTFCETASGDDDLIISALANVENTIVVSDSEAHTISKAPCNWTTYWRQKTRHVSSGKYYQFHVKLGLGIYAISIFFFWVLAIYLLINTTGLIHSLVLFLVIIKMLINLVNAFIWSSHLDTIKTAWFYPIGEWMWTIYNFLISPFIFWKNKKQWK